MPTLFAYVWGCVLALLQNAGGVKPQRAMMTLTSAQAQMTTGAQAACFLLAAHWQTITATGETTNATKNIAFVQRVDAL